MIHLPYASAAKSHRSPGSNPSCQHLLGLLIPKDKLLCEQKEPALPGGWKTMAGAEQRGL